MATRLRCTKVVDSFDRRLRPCRAQTAIPSRTSWWVASLPTWLHRTEARRAVCVCNVAAITSGFGTRKPVPDVKAKWNRPARKNSGRSLKKQARSIASLPFCQSDRHQPFLHLTSSILHHQSCPMPSSKPTSKAITFHPWPPPSPSASPKCARARNKKEILKPNQSCIGSNADVVCQVIQGVKTGIVRIAIQLPW